MDAAQRGGDALAVEYVRTHNRGSRPRGVHRLRAAGCAAHTMARRLKRFQQMATDVSARTGEKNEILGCIREPILDLALNRHAYSLRAADSLRRLLRYSLRTTPGSA